MTWENRGLHAKPSPVVMSRTRSERLKWYSALAGFALIFSLSPGLSRADDVAELRAALAEQGQQIETLQDELRSLSDQRANGAGLGSLSIEDVDERIESFQTHQTSQLFISGYGAAGYVNQEKNDSSFGMLFVPIFHYKLSDRLHLTGEVEFDLRGSESEVEVEYAQIDFLLNEYMTLSAGKFLLPFNAFSERIHPAWINKLPSLPPIYGGHGAGGGIVPVLSDSGVQLRGGVRLPWAFTEAGSRLNFAVYAINGPRIEPEDEVGEMFEGLADELAVQLGAPPIDVDALLAAAGVEEHETEIEFGENFSDNNNNKTIGGRVGFLPIPSLELGGSWMSGKYDDSSDLDFRMYGFDLAWRRGPWEFLGEFISQRFDTDDIGAQRINGYYAQGSLDLREVASWVGLPQDTVLDQIELVVRHGEVDNGLDFRETAFGLIYWIKPSVALKLAYTRLDEDRNEVDNDRFDVQLAYGF